jgi:hypothetical protein
MPETPSWAKADGGVQAIREPLIFNSKMTVKFQIDYTSDWDNLLAFGYWYSPVAFPPFTFQQPPVPGLSYMTCPPVWVLVCHDQACTSVELQAGAHGTSVNASARIGGRTSVVNDPHTGFWLPETEGCIYEIHHDAVSCLDANWPTSRCADGIPVAGGVNYAWVGMRCGDEQYVGGGDSTMFTGSLYVPVGTEINRLDLGHLTGPYNNKAKWTTIGNGCGSGPRIPQNPIAPVFTNCTSAINGHL